MSDQVPAVNPNLAKKFDPLRDGPPRGSWWWVADYDHEFLHFKKDDKYEAQPTDEVYSRDEETGDFTICRYKRIKDRLMCVTHLASNHVVFSQCSEHGGSTSMRVRYRDLPEMARPEPNWQAVLNKQIEDKKTELHEAVKQMTDSLVKVNLIEEQASDAPQTPTTMLPTLTRVSPEEHKRKLVKLKEKDFPAMEKRIEHITQELTALHRDLTLPMRAEADRMNKAMKRVDQRLFALELYAGLFQKCKQIKDGEPAPADTPITVRQMLRYMDEECLIDYASGGMDYSRVADFDAWVAKPENMNRIVPEARCVVALKVRRDAKDYGLTCDVLGLFDQLEKHHANMKTYLLIRNGERLFRLVTEIEFSPRLLPLRAEFHKPFEEREHKSSWGKGGPTGEDYKSWIETTTIDPDHLDYDKHAEERMGEIYKYNRVMFLLQGLLDRSKVFSPHPPINLSDDEHIEQFFKAVYDEEDGLPSHNPPDYDRYRASLNALLVTGNYVWSRWHPEEDYDTNYRTSYRSLKYHRRRPDICRVTSIKRDRSMVRVSWAWGEAYGWKPNPEKKGWLKWTSYQVERMKHTWIPMEQVFNITAYCTGDYKPFLCDAYQKGRYLRWAPQMLDGELWLRMKDSEREEFALYGEDSHLETWLKNKKILTRIKKSFKQPNEVPDPQPVPAGNDSDDAA